MKIKQVCEANGLTDRAIRCCICSDGVDANGYDDAFQPRYLQVEWEK